MMSANIYGVDLGTANLKIYCKANGAILNEKNTIARSEEHTSELQSQR